jgi:hypothetical protein
MHDIIRFMKAKYNVLALLELMTDKGAIFKLHAACTTDIVQ